MNFILKSDTIYSEDIFRKGHFVVLLGTINHAKKRVVGLVPKTRPK